MLPEVTRILPPPLIAILIGLMVVILILKILSPFIPQIRGRIGESKVRKILLKLPANEYISINDVLLHKDNGTTQIDHIVVSPFGIFVIETKNMKGKIYGDERSKKWTKYSAGHKLTFMNPIHQNYGHIKALQNFLNLPETIFVGIVVMTGSAELKFSTEYPVIYNNRLYGEITRHKLPVIEPEKALEIADKIKAASDNTAKSRKEHIQQIRKDLQ